MVFTMHVSSACLQDDRRKVRASQKTPLRKHAVGASLQRIRVQTLSFLSFLLYVESPADRLD